MPGPLSRGRVATYHDTVAAGMGGAVRYGPQTSRRTGFRVAGWEVLCHETPGSCVHDGSGRRLKVGPGQGPYRTRMGRQIPPRTLTRGELAREKRTQCKGARCRVHPRTITFLANAMETPNASAKSLHDLPARQSASIPCRPSSPVGAGWITPSLALFVRVSGDQARVGGYRPEHRVPRTGGARTRRS